MLVERTRTTTLPRVGWGVGRVCTVIGDEVDVKTAARWVGGRCGASAIVVDISRVRNRGRGVRVRDELGLSARFWMLLLPYSCFLSLRKQRQTLSESALKYLRDSFWRRDGREHALGVQNCRSVRCIILPAGLAAT